MRLAGAVLADPEVGRKYVEKGLKIHRLDKTQEILEQL
ncbi:hypothetical protein D1BOALGB6SA_4565 [Olavius sp. associated proteobacterium Delta 1]|nr:hypothetical protein D1BOALGB6SA_4565 [Olavius sp. associated proteobacterium Delta 1]